MNETNTLIEINSALSQIDTFIDGCHKDKKSIHDMIQSLDDYYLDIYPTENEYLMYLLNNYARHYLSALKDRQSLIEVMKEVLAHEEK